MKVSTNLRLTSLILSAFIAALTSGCGLSPQDVDLDLNQTLPEVNSTVFSQAIADLGKANVIYGRGPLRVMSKPVRDNTGTSLPTQGEIPQDISEMVKSALNAIGGEILYVPFDPEFMISTAQTGYTQWGDKYLPNVVLVGGLTEFDRGLVTKEEGADVSGSAEDLGVPMGLDFSDIRKSSLARITLDFNLVDFKTFTGIPFMQAVNSIRVHKGVGKDELGFTVYGQTLGLRGNIKKIQGRHAAIRLLVQLSIIQIVGKYQKLPYWRLIPNSQPDRVVLDQIREDYYRMGPTERIVKIQEYLYLYGKPVKITGRLDAATMQAIEAFKTEYGVTQTEPVSEALYLALFENVPLDVIAKVRRQQVNTMLAQYRQQANSTVAQTPVVQQTPKPAAPKKDAGQQPTLGELKVWTDKEQVVIGDEVAVFFKVSKPMFVRIVTVNAAGQVATLFPNPHQNDNYVLPGKTYRIPPSNAPFKLTAGAPAGVDKIRAVASPKPVTAEDLPLTSDGEFKPGNPKDAQRVYAGDEFQVLPQNQQNAAAQ